jgi:hypothetical protein
MACPEPKNGNIVTTGQQVIRAMLAVVWMLVLPLDLLLDLADSLDLGGG